MSKTTFKFSRRVVQFGKLNGRSEFHGDENVPATDFRITFRGTKRDLDVLCPQQDGSNGWKAFYTDDGHLKMPYLVPLAIQRKPEHLLIQVYDQNTARKTPPLVFADAKAKGIVVIMRPKFELEITMLLQVLVDPDAQAGRLYQCMGNERELELAAQQDEMDLFLTPDEKKAKQEDAFGDDEGSEEDDDLPDEGTDPEDDED